MFNYVKLRPFIGCGWNFKWVGISLDYQRRTFVTAKMWPGIHQYLKGRDGEEMKRVKLTVLLLISLGVVLVVIQNTAPVQARFLWMTAEVPAIVLLFVTAVGGFVAGLLAALLVKRGPQFRAKPG
jgi:uncharacterized integral membrane protein